jgi:hypothetical protein
MFQNVAMENPPVVFGLRHSPGKKAEDMFLRGKAWMVKNFHPYVLRMACGSLDTRPYKRPNP